MIIHGRTVQPGRFGSTPFGHATIKIAGIWKNLARVAEKPPSQPNIVFIHPPLYAEHPAGTRCIPGALYPAPNADTTLLHAAVAGGTKIYLADGTRLADGDLLRIDSRDQYREEFVSLKSIQRTNAADLSAAITLAQPLAFAHRVGVDLQKLESDWEDQDTTLAADGASGHSTLFIHELRRIRTNVYLRITASGKAAEEVHRVEFYETESNGQGFYRLPPLQRVGQVQLEASGDGGRKVVVMLQPDFSLPRNQVDFVFKKSQTPATAENDHA